ncbi:MAG: hypothetical protein NC823_01480, partial [Candidatus Omnitrophica bacterium]|nr:hypothetical protein [Candidatus Omnitrophota bacterium]
NKPFGQKVSPEIERAEWGFRFTHEILRADNELEKIVRQFGYGQPGCVVINYWEKEKTGGAPEVRVNNDKVKWTALWRVEDRKILLAMVNWNRSPEETGVEIIWGKQKSQVEWQNAENGQPISFDKLEFSGWEVKILQTEVRQVRREK